MLTILLCLGTSAGPVWADDQPPADPTTVVPTPTETGTTTPATTSATSAPTTTEPTATESAPSSQVVVADMADLRLQVWFEKSSYAAHEPVTAHARVTNVGTAGAGQVVVTSTGNLSNQYWHPFNPYGVTIEPGQTVEGTMTGSVMTTDDAVRLVVTTQPLGGEPDANPEDNTVSVSVPVVFVPGV